MLLSIALILIVGMGLGWVCTKCRLPALLGMLIAGVVMGPGLLGILDDSILNISAEIRKIALVIILTRAGLNLDLDVLKKLGRSAIMMCFVPAACELIGMLLLGPWLFGLTLLESAIVGSVLAAVSPAVVVPRMVKLMDEGYGTKKGIPQLILSGATVDDVFVIVLFTTFTGMSQGQKISVWSFVNIPVSIIVGVAIGFASGWILSKVFDKTNIRSVVKVVIVLAISLIYVAIEGMLETPITFSALIAIMFIGAAIKKYKSDEAAKLSAGYNKMWIVAEVFLFVLVGASVNITYLGHVGLTAILAIIGALVFRMIGVFLCVLGTDFNKKERMFAMIAYCPKATVQAAIGGMPLAMGLACGDLTLTIAVLAIVITAPLGAFAIDLTYQKLLTKDM